MLRPTPPPPLYSLPGKHPGLLHAGNIDLYNRPVVPNPHGGYSTVDSVSFGLPQGEVLMPTVVGGKVVSPIQALAHYRATGQNLGVFKNPKVADLYAQLLHLQQARLYGH